MKVLVVGATGTIGAAVAEALAAVGHDVVRAGRSSGDVRLDIADRSSIGRMYAEVGAVDAVVCTAGLARFGALPDLDDEAFELSLGNKGMGQVNLYLFFVAQHLGDHIAQFVVGCFLGREHVGFHLFLHPGIIARQPL